MAENLSRVLRVLELLSAASGDGLSTAELSEQADTATSTLYRMLSELERDGYVFRDSDRRLHANFSFEQRLISTDLSPLALRETCAQISAALECASEIILPRSQHLLWYITDEHPQQAIRLRAHPGFLRGTYELDSISRLALAHRSIDEIEGIWDTSGFHETGIARTMLSWPETVVRLEQVKPDSMEFDMLGNAKGVRRFCVAVTDNINRLVCLLAVAEAAIPVRDEPAHAERIRKVLMQGREQLLPSSYSIASGA